MGVYRGRRGGGLCAPVFPGYLDPRMHEDYAFMCVC